MCILTWGLARRVQEYVHLWWERDIGSMWILVDHVWLATLHSYDEQWHMDEERSAWCACKPRFQEHWCGVSHGINEDKGAKQFSCCVFHLLAARSSCMWICCPRPCKWPTLGMVHVLCNLNTDLLVVTCHGKLHCAWVCVRACVRVMFQVTWFSMWECLLLIQDATKSRQAQGIADEHFVQATPMTLLCARVDGAC